MAAVRSLSGTDMCSEFVSAHGDLPIFEPILRSTQIWRLVTNFFIVSKPSFKLVIYCMWVVSYVVSAAALLHWGQEFGGRRLGGWLEIREDWI